MNELRVEMGEWFLTQGLVGYKTILEEYGEKIETTYNGLIVEERHLKILVEAFFSYYLDKYSVARREERVLLGLHKRFRDGDTTIKTTINTRLNDLKKSAHRYFKETKEGEKLGLAADTYRKEKKYNPQLDDLLNEFLKMLYTKEINEKLTGNYYKAVHLTPYFGQVSFLNVSNNSKSLEEQKEIFYKDFIYPILEEWRLYSALEKNDELSVDYILNETKYTLFNPIKRGFRKKSIEEKQEFMKQEVHKCSLTDFPIALLNFEEGMFSPLALSLRNARNMSWDANEKRFLPICSLARLLIFCAQAGATDTDGKSAFVFYGGSFGEIYQSNKSYSDFKSTNKVFAEIVFDLVREQKVKANYLNNRYIIYEYESDYQAKKTLLDYMVMTPNVIKLFSEHSNLFNYIHYTLKNNMIRFLLKGIDARNLITEELRKRIKDNYPVLDIIRLTQIRHLNKIYKKEDEKMDSSIERRRVWALVKSAEQVKHKIGIKKAQGIAYRLLNSVRSNDKNTFMDTVMRVYISSDLEMPGLLLEALHEDKMDFATVGNAWIAGLVSKPKDNEEGEERDE